MALVSDILDLLSRPGHAVSGLIRGTPQKKGIQFALENLKGTREDTSADILRDAGVTDPVNLAALGLVGDIALDPLNAVGGAAKAANLAGGVRKGVLSTIKQSNLGRGAIDLFSRYENLPEGYRDTKRLLDSELTHQPHTVAERVRQIWHDAGGKAVTLDERKAASRALEQGLEGVQDPSGRVAKLVEGARKYLDELYESEQASGVMPREKIENYFPYLFRKEEFAPETGLAIRAAIDAKNPHALQRKLKNFDEFLSFKDAEPIDDVLEALIARGQRGSKAASTANFLTSLAKDGRFANDLANAPLNWKPVAPGKMTGMDVAKQLENIRFAPEVMQDINKLLAVEKTNPAVDAVERLNQMWKGAATYLRPGFHVTNLMGNAWNMALGGADTNAILKAVSGTKTGDILSGMSPEAAAFAKKHGLVGGAVHTMRDIAGPKGPQVVDEILNVGSKNPLKRYGEFARQVGGNMEDRSKLAFFENYMKRNPKGLQGDALLQDALFATKRYLFDYQELTDMERKIRLGVPFYTFFKKNLPIQLEGLMNSPELFSRMEHVSHAAEPGIEKGQKVVDEAIPKWVKDSGGFQIANQFLNPSKSLFFRPNLPFQDLNAIDVTDPQEALKNLTSRIQPFLKMGPELAQNKEWFSGKPVWNPNLGMTEGLLKDTAKNPMFDKLFGLVGMKGTPKGVDYLSRQIPIVSQVSKGMGATEEMMNNNTLPAALINFLMGLGITEQSDEQLRKNVDYTNRRQKARQTTLDRLASEAYNE